MKYIIDSNCFIEPHRGFCPTDVGVSFWNKLKELYDRDILYSVEKVKEELFMHEDDLMLIKLICIWSHLLLQILMNGKWCLRKYQHLINSQK